MSLVSRTVGLRRKSISDSDVVTKEDKEKANDHDLKPVEPKAFVGCWEEAPDYAHDNEYIRKGYRINFNSIKEVVKSLFILHNESMNVWSHLCGVILFICLITYVAVWISPRFVFPTIDIIKEQMSKRAAITSPVLPAVGAVQSDNK